MGSVLKGLCVCLAVASHAVVSAAPIRPTEGYLPRFSRRVKPAVRGRIPLVVHFPDLPGVSELPATFGVPFPRGALKSAENVRMATASGREAPCVVRRTATWERRDGDVRWILIEASIKKGETYLLEYGASVIRSHAKGALSVAEDGESITVNTGPLRLAFSKTNSALISSAALGERSLLSPDRQKRMSIMDQAGAKIETSDRPEDYKIEVEQSDSLHAIVKAAGWYRRSDGTKPMQYVTRVHAYAGQPFVRVAHTFVVNYDTEKTRLKDIQIPFVLNLRNARAAFGMDAAEPANAREAPGGYLLQGHHKRFALKSAGGQIVAKGERASGWFGLYAKDAGLTIGLRRIWQEYPKELDASGHEMRVHLWPAHDSPPLDFDAKAQLGPERYKRWNKIWHRTLYEGGLDKYDQAMGIAKTNELVLAFHASDRARAVSHCMTLERPLVVCADPDWMCKSDAFGRLCAAKSSKRPDVERKMALGFESFGRRRREREGYGMIHYGDVHGKGADKGWRHWASRFYGFPVLPYIMFVRTGDPKYLAFGLDNSKHVMDIDMCHVANLKYGDYGKRCPKKPGKRRGGRYAGDGGIIHYAGHLYDIGCDSHVDQWTYAYYLTGYRRAWDVLNEEGEYYLWIDKRKESPSFQRYAHRMTGGGMRTLIGLYRATWDERYLKLADRLAGFCYKAQDKDGIIRYDDVYMNPGMFTYYQTTGDKRMLGLFLRCSRKHADLVRPLTDTRFFLFYGPSMAYFATGDPSYLPRAVSWMDDFLASPDGSGGYMALTVQLNYLPYLLEALRTTDKPVQPRSTPVATHGEVLLRRDGTARFDVDVRWACYDRAYLGGRGFPEWPRYAKRNRISARVVVRDAALREVAAREINLLKPRVIRRKRLVETVGDIALSVPAGPPGVYRVAIEASRPAPLKLFLMRTSLKKFVYRASPEDVAFGSRYHFLVPKGRRKFRLRIRAQILRSRLCVRVFDPAGRVVRKWQTLVGSDALTEYNTIEWDVPAGADGKVWSFAALPHEKVAGLYVKLDGPPWLATSAEAFFVPDAKLPPRSGLKGPDPADPAQGKILRLPAGKSLVVSRGAKRKAGRYERLDASEGTVEFLLRPGWRRDDVSNRALASCGKLRVFRRGSIGTYVYIGKKGHQSGFVMTPGYWYHVAVVWRPAAGAARGTAARLFVNGVSVGSVVSQEDWAGKDLRIGSRAPLDVARLRISDTARYREDFVPNPLGAPDGHTLVQLDLGAPLPKFAKVR